MTELHTIEQRDVRFQAVFASTVIISLTAAIFVGLNLVTSKNCIILPKSPFEEYGFTQAVIKICALDVVLLWILSLPFSKRMTVFVSGVVFFFRGLVIGNACRVFFENSVSSIAVTVLVSYSAVTLLSMFYDAFLNGFEERGALCRILSCFVVTGACAVIRVLPMFLLD